MATLIQSQLMEKFLDQKFQQLLVNMENRYEDFDKKLKHQMSTMETKLHNLLEKMEERYQDFDKKLNLQMNTMEILKSIFKEFQAKISSLETRQKTIEEENQSMITKFDNIEKKNQELKHRIKELELFTQDTVQEANQCKLEVTGVPSGVDYAVFTNLLFQTANLRTIIQGEYSITAIDKKNTHGSSPEFKNLVINLQNKEKRNSVIAALRKDRPNLTVKNVTGRGLETPIYISEFLTPQLKRVLYKAKQIKKENNYQFLWVKNGQILLRKTPKDDVVRISSLEELDHL